MRLASICAAGLLASTAAIAQTDHVLPRFFTSFEGNSNSSIPFTSAQYRYQQIIADAKAVPISGISSIAFRRDGALNTTSTARTVNVGIVMSHASIVTASPVFADNYVGGATTVVTTKSFNLPARTVQPPPRPGPWDVVLPFDVKFNYDGTRDLLYELITSNLTPTGAYYLDFATEGLNGVTADSNVIGTGCLATGRTSPVTLSTTTSTDRTSGSISFAFRAINGPATTIGSVFLIGASNPNLTVPGLCGDGKLYTDALFAVPPASYSSGTFTTPTVQVPWSAGWALASLYVQAGAIDGGLSNPIKVAVSNGLKVTLPPYLFPDFQGTRVYATNNAATSGTLDTGTIVTRFQN